jgi:hypothetical protein
MATARRPSANTIARCSGVISGGSRSGSVMTCRNRAAYASSASGVAIRRYFRTKAAMPRATSHVATSKPSLSTVSMWCAPPGQTITAVPVARSGSGRNAVSVGRVTLRT